LFDKPLNNLIDYHNKAHHEKLWVTFVKTYALYISWLEWRLGDSLGISVTNETLERATRVKRLIGRPQESAQSERKSTTRYGDEPTTTLMM